MRPTKASIFIITGEGPSEVIATDKTESFITAGVTIGDIVLYNTSYTVVTGLTANKLSTETTPTAPFRVVRGMVVHIKALDAAGKRAEEFVLLNQPTSRSYFRINKMVALKPTTASITATGDEGVEAFIPAGKRVNARIGDTVPAGKTGLLRGLDIDFEDAEEVSLELNGLTFNSRGNTRMEIKLAQPLRLPALTDVELRKTSATPVRFTANLDLIFEG